MTFLIIVIGIGVMVANKDVVCSTDAKMIFLGLYLVAIAISGVADRIGKEIKDAFSRIVLTSSGRS